MVAGDGMAAWELYEPHVRSELFSLTLGQARTPPAEGDGRAGNGTPARGGSHRAAAELALSQPSMRDRHWQDARSFARSRMAAFAKAPVFVDNRVETFSPCGRPVRLMRLLQWTAALRLPVVAASFSLAMGVACGQAGTPITNPALPTATRVDDLVRRMTLEEKASQMVDQSPAIPRLGVPEYNWWNEGLHGIARSGYATMFPQAIGMAATWDQGLIGQEANVIATEARAKYNRAIAEGNHGRYFGLTVWSPNINIFRDPRWGRGQETYGEDPYLTGTLGTAFVRGLQGAGPGTDAKYYKVIANAEALCRPLRPRKPAAPIRRAAFAVRPGVHLSPGLSRDGG